MGIERLINWESLFIENQKIMSRRLTKLEKVIRNPAPKTEIKDVLSEYKSGDI